MSGQSGARVRAAQFTGTKITGLEVQARESYLSLLQKNMRANHSEWQKYATEAESAADRDTIQYTYESSQKYS